ncbi:hypothetical protein Taro_042755 [Colocasia esculenta]|uniref:ABC transporter domain-containing protein n=1 Tax=Colocasia esculenta TaxID=4460 RepID=A0A843WZ80_COLES|nr:hypothetical protein [Colocasia esculenta]
MQAVELQSRNNPDVEDGEGGETAASVFSRCQLPFEDVVYKIPSKRPPLSTSTGTKNSMRTILDGVCGIVRPGEMLAMLGPSGSGKTTLLTALGGRLGGDLDGNITFNGQAFSSSMKRRIGFVTQDDVLYQHLTVAETLLYTALLRLPRSLSRVEKAGVADAVMAQLGLSICRDSIIGGPTLRGISGGERKRVSIGQEMLINPSLIFLDEPTSGLDSTTAQRIVTTLGELARGGRTVVMTIHQPSSGLFYKFHRVLLLSQGSPLYFGEASTAMTYFSRLGYAPSVPMNPADFLLDLANGISPDDSVDPQTVRQALVSAYADNIQQVLKQELQEMNKHVSEREHDKKPSQWTTTWWEQFTVLLQRGMKERKHEAFSVLKVAQVVATALLAGLLWWQSSGRIQDQIGLIFFITGFCGFYPLFDAIFTFPQEREILQKERSSGMYRLSSYFMARTVGDMPMEFVLPIFLITVDYWMGGMRPEASAFFLTLFPSLLGVMVSQGLGLALGALVMDLKTATTMGSVLMLTFMLSGGFFVQRVPWFVSWIKYISVVYYLYRVGLNAQFSPHDTYQCGAGATCAVADYPAIKAVGIGGEGACIGALLAMMVLYRLAAYIGLMRVGVARGSCKMR